MAQIHLIDWAVVLAYLVGIAAMGRYFARRQRDTQDFFLGEAADALDGCRAECDGVLGVDRWLLGGPGEVIRHGAGILWRQIGLPFGAAITIFVIIPYFQRTQITTAFELLRNRFGRKAELVGVGVWAYMQVAFLVRVLQISGVKLISAPVPYWE